MLIKVLAENTALNDDYACEHGLSLYLETGGLNVLFDVGASDLFLANAARLGVDIAAVDLLIISHGHYDHGGGLEAFLQVNRRAPVHVDENAFRPFYSAAGDQRLNEIGLEPSLRDDGRIVLGSGDRTIAPGIEIFSNAGLHEAWPGANRGLFTECGGKIVPDDFAHEQHLLVEEDGRLFLLTGCAHGGIAAIIERAARLKGRMPDAVLGGFHLAGHRQDLDVDAGALDDIGRYFGGTGASFYTGHCTGSDVIRRLQSVLGDSLSALSSGLTLTL